LYLLTLSMTQETLNTLAYSDIAITCNYSQGIL
jgi:hypothetical protein